MKTHPSILSVFVLPVWALMLVLSSCGQPSDDGSATHAVADREPIPVQTATAGSQSADATSILSGTIQAKNKATVSAQMMGYVTTLQVDVGDRVGAGQRILTIKNNELPARRAQMDAGIAEAQAALNNVKLNYDRMKTLWEQESITRKEWDDVSAQYQMMQAKVDGATSMKNEVDEVIALTTVRAPISGTVTAKMINLGDLVNPGIPLMTIEGNQGYEVVTQVSDVHISSLKKGMKVTCKVKSLDQEIQATITEVSPSAVNTAGQFTVKAALTLNGNEKKSVFPGMFAHVHVDLPKTASSIPTSNLVVDKSAIIQRGQLTGLFTISQQETAMLRWVQLGKDYGDQVEVVTGLMPGEEYIISDLARLIDGIPVKK